VPSFAGAPALRKLLEAGLRAGRRFGTQACHVPVNRMNKTKRIIKKPEIIFIEKAIQIERKNHGRRKGS
jgi:hypothetical protein